MTVKALGYLVIEATDIPKWDSFLKDIVGVMPSGQSASGASLYRVDDRVFRFWIESGEQDRLVAAGYELSADSFDSTLQIIRDAGRDVSLASDEEATDRGVAKFARTTDPAGNGLEFFCGDTLADSPFVSPLGIKSFVTGEMGMGHAVFAAPDFEASHDFYKSIGFSDTDVPSFQLMGEDGPTTHFAFMHASNQRHHSIALGEMPVPPSNCIHTMLEVDNLDEVGRAFDRVKEAGYPVSATIGKHTNDEMISFYVQTPGGFDLEFGYDGLVIEPEIWEPTAHVTISQWGHAWAWQEEMKKQMEQQNAAEGSAN